MASDEQFTALGDEDGTEIGFQTNSTDIRIGADIAGNELGIRGHCIAGPGIVGESTGRMGVAGTGTPGVFGHGNKNGATGFNGVMGVVEGDEGAGVFGGIRKLNRQLPLDETSFDPARSPGAGVFGVSTDLAYGVLGKSRLGNGVLGKSTLGHGVVGESHAIGKSGVYGFNTQLPDATLFAPVGTFGVVGRCDAPDGAGVGGRSSLGVGIRGQSSSNDGVVGFCGGNHKSGVFGFNSKTQGIAFGVVGRCDSNQGVGGDGGNGSGGIDVRGTSAAGVGVQGTSNDGVGMTASSKNNDALFASAEKGNGVIAVSDGSGNGVVAFSNFGTAVLAMVPVRPSGNTLPPAGSGRLAGHFVGPVLIEGIQQVLLDQIVNGNQVVLGTKSAAMSHPDGSHRLLYSLESPESWFEDFGEGKLVDGKAEVCLDPDFAAVIKRNKYHVLVTPYSNSIGLYVTHRNSKGFQVQEQNDGRSNLAFSYRIVAKRKGIKAERLARITVPEHPTLKVPKRPRMPVGKKRSTSDSSSYRKRSA